MRCKKFYDAKLAALALVFAVRSATMLGQGLLVDQATGPNLQSTALPIPDNQLVQSFTPSFSAVGFVQFAMAVLANPNVPSVTVLVNLRQNSYDGPVISSTDPVVAMNRITQVQTFYFPGNVPLTAEQVYFLEPVILSAGRMDIDDIGPSTYVRGVLFNNGVPAGAGDLWFQEGIVVPEPSEVWLFLFGGAVLLWRLRVGRRSEI